MTYATVHMKGGKYAVLLYPILSGQSRRRVYVGKDPHKVQDAIQRAKDYDALAKQAAWLEAVLTHGCRSLQEAAKELSSWRP